MRHTGTFEFVWDGKAESPPALFAVLEAKHLADETFEATWADGPPMRYKVLAMSRSLGTNTITATFDFVAEHTPVPNPAP